MGTVANKSARTERHERNLTLVAAGAGLVGALLGGGLSLGATYLQAEQAREQSQSDFLRTERKDAYSNFVISARESLREAKEEHAAIEVSDAPGARSASSVKIAKLADAVKANQGAVLMLGTPDVAKLSQDLSFEYTLLVKYAFEFADARESGQGFDAARKNLDGAEDRVAETIDSFTSAARTDLGVENHP